MEAQQEIGKLFLQEFIKSIIKEKGKSLGASQLNRAIRNQIVADLRYLPPIPKISEIKTENLEKQITNIEKPKPIQINPQINKTPQISTEKQLIQEMFERNLKNIQRRLVPQRRPLPQQQMMPSMHQMRPQPIMQQIPFQAQKSSLIPPKPQQTEERPSVEKITIEALGKIKKFIDDKSLQTIECPGPGKPILVYRSGAIQATNVTLTSEEITKIMKEISEKTRIPLMSGVFKAAFDEFIITSVMSEFVGTRFMLQRKPKTPEA